MGKHKYASFFSVGENRTSADASQFQAASGPAEQENQNDRVPDDHPTRVGEPVPGSYCVYRYSRLQYEEREGESNPKPSKGIVVNNGIKLT